MTRQIHSLSGAPYRSAILLLLAFGVLAGGCSVLPKELVASLGERKADVERSVAMFQGAEPPASALREAKKHYQGARQDNELLLAAFERAIRNSRAVEAASSERLESQAQVSATDFVNYVERYLGAHTPDVERSPGGLLAAITGIGELFRLIGEYSERQREQALKELRGLRWSEFDEIPPRNPR